ncbi:MAG: iron-containing alcohol dehydrogenase, partial [Emcibacteraceae bacterium]
AILMPYVLKANRSVIENDIAWLSQTIGLEKNFDAFQNWVLSLRKELKIPHSLAGIDITPDCVEHIGAMSQIDPSAGTNPILFNEKQYSRICLDAINGTL